MASTFTVNRADGYEQLMGRWSRRLAPPFIAFAGAEDGDRILDVGCGTGSLTFALPHAANVGAITGIDFSPIFVEEARRRNSDGRIHIEQGDASALQFADASFDRAMALLVLHFVPDAARAVGEMKRVVRPGGVVAAAVWDHLGGLSSMRMMWDTVAATSESGRAARSRYLFQPMMAPGEMERCFRDQGLTDVVQDVITIRMDYADFDDYWRPIAEGEGPIGKYVSSVDAAAQQAMAEAVRAAYEGGKADGPRSFAASAWVCRGIVPATNQAAH